MLWQRTPVYDPASGKTLYVRHLSAHQPDIEREIYRAAVCEQEIGHTAVKEVVVGKIAGRWTVYQSAEGRAEPRSEEHTSELQSLMRISYAVFCLQPPKSTRTETPFPYATLFRS